MGVLKVHLNALPLSLHLSCSAEQGLNVDTDL